MSSHKITPDHLSRRACLYIRQSSLRQVRHNTESQVRQYGLRERAIALGWPEDQIDIIDEDQGKSGATSAQRTGFQDLRARVGAGEVGIVLSLEVSRLCRDNAEWHNLLRIAAISKTLILDEHGIYDVSDLNDWMLLGLKGQLSEYELRGISARMLGGQRSKARRGELRLPLPIGLVYAERDRVVKDPDQSITEAVDLLFKTFQRLGSASQVTKWFWEHEISLPARPRRGGGKVVWGLPNRNQIQRMLKNPRYAGCYAYGRTRTHRRPDGTVRYATLPRDQWMVCIPAAHVGYIDWEEYLQNQETLHKNMLSIHPNLGRIPSPRAGAALLQSCVICGVCGYRMRTSYTRQRRPYWYYRCGENAIGLLSCQSVHGPVLDAAIGRFVVAAINKENLALSLTVREQLRSDFETADRQRCNHIENLRHQMELARRRYAEVDPSNRLVAATLETEWEACLRAHSEAVREREQFVKASTCMPEAELDRRILELARDFGKVWAAEETTNVDRKRLLRLIIEDITVTRVDNKVVAGLRLRGGRLHELPPIDLPLRRAEAIRRDISREALGELETLLEEGYADAGAAEELNRRGYRDSLGGQLNKKRIQNVRQRNNLPGGLQRKCDNLRTQGYKSRKEIAAELNISVRTVSQLAREARGVEGYALPGRKHPRAMYRIIPETQTKHAASL